MSTGRRRGLSALFSRFRGPFSLPYRGCAVAIRFPQPPKSEDRPDVTDAAEDEALEAWEIERLLHLEFTVEQAAVLARCGVSWHDADELTRVRGCPTDLAFDLLS